MASASGGELGPTGRRCQGPASAVRLGARRAPRGALPGLSEPFRRRANASRTHMILIGQYDSPFVRRVAIALRIYGMAYEHRPWSVFGNADDIAVYNPLRRVPTLVAD